MATAKKPDPNRGRRRKPTQPPSDAAPAAQPLARPAADATADAPEKGPLRRCIVTRESGPKEAMLRFVLGPDRGVVPDLAGKLPGRGMWLSARADVLERAVKRGAFAKAARGTVYLPPDLAARIEDGLKGRIRDLVGFARRSGKAVCGRESVREWLQAGKAGLLVEASDGSAAERSRLVGRRDVPVVAPLPADVLGSVFARDHAVHVAIAPGRLAEAIALETARLAGMLRVGAAGAATPSPRGDGAGHRRDGPMGQ
ncbi:RNA-binding protein [Dankookia rubra]|uniref:RNA-binding protein n=1 Tax=Dankookia rubra TaxID=1442381 RepID=A0A4R5QB94_9PROT|nr:RNA-binding protein [Dankookia rubra]TDH59641.1 RNA-binding protein [Dankookia rubra]